MKKKSHKKSEKFYAVKCGRNPGIYNTWDECEMQVKYYSGARYKSFKSIEEAKKYMEAELNVFIPYEMTDIVKKYKNGVRVV